MIKSTWNVPFLTARLHASIRQILDDELKMSGNISLRGCSEIIEHHCRDMNRLYADHHQLVHPTKHCSYLAFWIRKLKPVSFAYPISLLEGMTPTDATPDAEHEDTEINEKIAIVYAFKLLALYIENEHVKLPGKMSKENFITNFKKAIENFLKDVPDEYQSTGNRFRLLIYDMKYRTFGPHHLTHTLIQILREAGNVRKS